MRSTILFKTANTIKASFNATSFLYIVHVYVFIYTLTLNVMGLIFDIYEW